MENEIKNEIEKSEEGATLVEYVLLVALIAIVIIAAATFLGTTTSSTLSHVGSTMNATRGATVGP